MADGQTYRYHAADAAGRRSKGTVVAEGEALAFELLRSQGLAPLSLRLARGRAASPRRRTAHLSDRESAEFLTSLADLLRAGADIRTSLAILGGGAAKPGVTALAEGLNVRISRGEALERAFAGGFGGRRAYVPAMVAAGEAAGDLPGALQRAGEILAVRLALRDQLLSVLAYPAFVSVSSLGALLVILLFIVPSIAPLAADVGSAPPASLAVLIWASDLLRGHAVGLGLTWVAVGLVGWIVWRAGILVEPLERLALDGPFRRTTRGIVFGSFAVSLGAMLGAGASVTDALRLASEALAGRVARARLEVVLRQVREGRGLSAALAAVEGFPGSIVRLTAVGEASNSLGAMLSRGGRLEEEAALQRIQKLGRMSGPVLIILLGLLLGTLMGGLLSGVSQMGQSALG